MLAGPTQSSCHHCIREPLKGEPKFKACKGCTFVIYCSRECQMQDWPTHKTNCRQVVGIRKLDESALPRARVLSNFINLHETSIHQACYSAVCLHNGGVLEGFDYDAHFIHIFLLRRNDWDGNTCKAYQVGHVQLLRIESFDWNKTDVHRMHIHQLRQLDPRMEESEKRRGLVTVGRMNMLIESLKDGGHAAKMRLSYDKIIPYLQATQPWRFVPTNHNRWAERLSEIMDSGLVWRKGNRDWSNVVKECDEKGYYDLCRMKKVKSGWEWEALSEKEMEPWGRPPLQGLSF